MTAPTHRADLTRYPARSLVAVCTALALPLLAACTDNATTASSAPAANPRALTVQATDTSCTLSAATAPSGKLTFSVTNGGSKVTEFYLLGEDNLRIVAEIENIGPGLSRDLVLNAAAGSYFTACKPGMVGEGIRAPFAISESGESGPTGNECRPSEGPDRAAGGQDRAVRRALQGRQR